MAEAPRFALPTAPYRQQTAGWPDSGRHILAQYDDHSIIVYQAYRPVIGRFVLDHGYFGGPDFSLSRMSWVKPNFLWMMYRSGWGTKEGQEIILGLRLTRAFFEHILESAVPSTFDPALFSSVSQWQTALAASEARLQWDPDHAPDGGKLARKAIQLGLRGQLKARYAREALLEVIDCSAFVAAQRQHLPDVEQLSTPLEQVYPVASALARRRVLL